MRPTKQRLACASAAVLVAAVAAVAAGGALAASPTGTVSETINVGVRSLTVSPTSVNQCSTQSPLPFPDSTCVSSPIAITNGPAGGHIDINGASALPSDGSGNGWALCGSPGPACTGNAALIPGVDEYLERSAPSAGGTESPPLTNTPQCDTGFDSNGSGCVSNPAQVASEIVILFGPSSSSDQSPTFNTTVTWTAAP